MMMKTILDTIFAKNTKSSFVSTSQSAVSTHHPREQASNAQLSSAKNENAPQTNKKNQEDVEFNNMAYENAYEVAEISLEEFKYTGPERRRFPRKPGETRSCYSTNNQATQSAPSK